MTDDQVYYAVLDAPIGRVLVAWESAGLASIRFGPTLATHAPPNEWIHAPGTKNDATEQLLAYFSGELHEFDLPVAARGTPFQRLVWSAVAEIPHGETWSYAEVAARIRRPRAVRAVGSANARNPVPIVVPCHRVIGSGGKLVGYAGGLDLKERLLAFERSGSWEPATLL